MKRVWTEDEEGWIEEDGRRIKRGVDGGRWREDEEGWIKEDERRMKSGGLRKMDEGRRGVDGGRWMKDEERVDRGRRGGEWRMKRGWIKDEVRIEAGLGEDGLQEQVEVKRVWMEEEEEETYGEKREEGFRKEE